jgi:hypothetical protein
MPVLFEAFGMIRDRLHSPPTSENNGTLLALNNFCFANV